MNRYLFPFLFLLTIDIFVYCVWFVLGWVFSFSTLFTWILGIAALFICPIVVYLVGMLVESKYTSTSALFSAGMTVVLILSSVLFVPVFTEQNICSSTFSSARSDAETCDYLCFSSLVLEPEKTFEYTYTYKNTAKEYSTKDFSFVPIQLPKDQFIWVEIQEEDGNCMYVYRKSDEYKKMYELLQKPVLGRLVNDPQEDIHEMRMISIYCVAILNIMSLLLGFRYAQPMDS